MQKNNVICKTKHNSDPDEAEINSRRLRILNSKTAESQAADTSSRINAGRRQRGEFLHRKLMPRNIVLHYFRSY